MVKGKQHFAYPVSMQGSQPAKAALLQHTQRTFCC
jgi:hypothetical protein